MKFYLISDNIDTQLGLRMAGVEGVVVREPNEAGQALRRAIRDESIGIVLITEALAERCADQIYEIKTSVSRPLILEIPDRHGTRTKDSVTRYVREAIGVKF